MAAGLDVCSQSCGGLQVMDFLGSAALSKAVQALDLKTGMLVCLKIVKVTAQQRIPSSRVLGSVSM